MARETFINLPVADLDRSLDFFEALGMEALPYFESDHTAAVALSPGTTLMLLTRERFSGFVPVMTPEHSDETAMLIALHFDTIEEVDRLAEAALEAGGRERRAPQDHGFMYGRAITDPDGHVFELMWMDETADPRLQETEG